MISNKEIIEIGSNCLREEMNAIDLALQKLSDDFAQAARLIASSNKIIVSGVGKSGIIAKKIAATFSSIGVSSLFLHPVEALHGDIGVVQDGDVAILLSKSGTTDELVKLIPYLRMRNSSIISILGNIDSVISKFSDIVLDASVSKEACPFNLAPTTSSTLALALGDALAVSVMKIKNVTINDFSRLHPLGQIGRSITVKVCDVMHKDEKIPKITANDSLRNALIEMTKKDLGCVFSVDNNMVLSGILTDGDIRRILQKTEDFTGLMMSDVMTKLPVSVGEDAYLHEALALMENRDSEISVLPVVKNDNTLVGVIRIHDIVRSGS